MRLPASVPPQLLPFKNDVENAFYRLRSVKAEIYAEVTDLPKPNDFWNGRSVIVRDIDGLGNPGHATCLDGAWYDSSWSAL